jgi:hypothetical protein
MSAAVAVGASVRGSREFDLWQRPEA